MFQAPGHVCHSLSFDYCHTYVDAGASPVETGSIRTEEDGVSGCMILEM